MGGSQVNKFEWVSSLGHQMSLVRLLYSEGPCLLLGLGVPVVRSHVWGQGWGGVGVYSTVKSRIQGAGTRTRGSGWEVLVWWGSMGNGHMGHPRTEWLTDGQTRLKTLPYCNFVEEICILSFFCYKPVLDQSRFRTSRGCVNFDTRGEVSEKVLFKSYKYYASWFSEKKMSMNWTSGFIDLEMGSQRSEKHDGQQF